MLKRIILSILLIGLALYMVGVVSTPDIGVVNDSFTWNPSDWTGRVQAAIIILFIVCSGMIAAFQANRIKVE